MARLGLLGLLVACASGVAPDGDLPSAAVLQNATSELLAAGGAVFGGAVVVPGAAGGAVARRLFGFPSIDVGGIVSQAEQWVESTSGRLASVAGMSDVIKLFNEAKTHVDQGLQVATAGWNSMQDMAARLLKVFTDFAPLKPVFASKDGFTKLVSSPTNMKTLVGVVRELLGTSSVLEALSGAMAKVSSMFVELDKFFKGLLGKLGGRRLSGEERRLASSYSELLSGLNFAGLAKEMQKYLKGMSETSVTLTEIQDVLGPLLVSLETKLSGRRLGITDILKDAQKYSGVISKIVPTWQGMEALGINMCPQVGLAKDEVSSLQCRVMEFTKQAALPSFAASALGGLVSGCGGKPAPPAKGAAGNSCPTSSSSAGVANLLGGANGNLLGVVLAMAVAGGCLGGGAMAGAKAMGGSGGTGSGDEDENDDDEKLVE